MYILLSKCFIFETPGAFAIFLSFGVRIKRALFLLSTRYILSYVGVVIGVLLGASLSGWIFAVIAGMFLYIALAEMVSGRRIRFLQKALSSSSKVGEVVRTLAFRQCRVESIPDSKPFV